MNKWHSLNLGGGLEAYEPTRKIQEAFWPIHFSLGSPNDMGVYSKYDNSQNIVTLYFTPSATPLAKMFNATECDEPSSDWLTFVVGPGSCLDVWPTSKIGS